LATSMARAATWVFFVLLIPTSVAKNNTSSPTSFPTPYPTRPDTKSQDYCKLNNNYEKCGIYSKSCKSLKGSFRCVCACDYTGVFCTKKPNSTCSHDQDCHNNGECKAKNTTCGNKYNTCHCKFGYNGKHCENDLSGCIDPDDPETFCHGHGKCRLFQKNTKASCHCLHRREGKYCENKKKSQGAKQDSYSSTVTIVIVTITILTIVLGWLWIRQMFPTLIRTRSAIEMNSQSGFEAVPEPMEDEDVLDGGSLEGDSSDK